MNRNRRSTKVETRLETLEGRITPSGMATFPVVGAQILVMSPEAPSTRTGLSKPEIRALHHYEHIKSPTRAEVFLRHHEKLANWLEKFSDGPYSAPNATAGLAVGGTSQGLASNSGPSNSGASNSGPSNSGPSNPPTNTGQDTNTGQPTTQKPAPSINSATAATQDEGSTTTRSTAPSLPANLDATLSQIYQDRSDSIANLQTAFANQATFSGNDVEVAIRGNGGDFSELLQEVTSLDSNISVTDSSETYQTIDADVPIADLVNLANDADQLVQSVTSIAPPIAN